MSLMPHILALLRSPKFIVGELVGLALFGAVGAARENWHVFKTPGFTALAALMAASLSLVVGEQFRRLRAGWTRPLAESSFQSAPFRAEFERPATFSRPEKKIWSERRLGLAGSFVFHSGLLLLILAGMLRALFAADAMTDVLENETLAPQASAWGGQFPGVAARPFALDREMTLREVKAARYAGGDLQSLSLRIGVDGADREICVNQELRLGGNRIFSAREFGPAVLVESLHAGNTTRCAVLLAENGAGNYEGELALANNLRAHFRSYVDRNGTRPGIVELRVMRGHALLAVESMPAGASLALPDDVKITLQGLPFWARLHGSRDAALWLAYLGMLLTMTGAAMMFCLVKLDFCVVVTPLGKREKVFVALKPQRFAPLFQERFEKLICEFGGNHSIAGILQQPVGRFPLSLGERAGVRADVPPPIHPSSILHSLSSSPARTASWLLFAACLALTSGCDRRVSTTQARQLVERYNQVVSEAYRRGDIRLVDPVVGPNEGKKLTGLIGVRLDMGITLDSKLLSLEVVSTEQVKNELRVRTKERWSYRDLKIGTGAQVGQASQDTYEMTYFFTNVAKAWLVDEIKFATPPQVGRTNTPWVADRASLHGTDKPEAKP